MLRMVSTNHDKALETVRQRAPGVGAWAELAEGVIWVRLPMPGALSHVNVWLLESPDGWFLVDTGIKTRAVEQAWVRFESQLPIAARLRSVVVTHHHPDHFGMANWFVERHGIEVQMGPRAYAATAGVLGDLDVGPGKGLRSFAERLGIELDDDTAAILGGRMYKSVVSGRPPVREIAAGSTISGARGDWQVSLHDGHAPDHLCLYAPHAGILVSGDQVLPTISSNISLYPSNEMSDPLGDYLESLEALRELPAETLVLPAHGTPFEGLHARLDALAQEHGSRLEKITAFCSMPRSTADVAGSLFNVHRLDGLNRLLAMTETLAHLRYLEQRGIVQRTGLGQALRWQAG
jgi:glyoxylase-like metal-dependent hydrolase (beta-lactamase superfamily II)